MWIQFKNQRKSHRTKLCTRKIYAWQLDIRHLRNAFIWKYTQSSVQFLLLFKLVRFCSIFFGFWAKYFGLLLLRRCQTASQSILTKGSPNFSLPLIHPLNVFLQFRKNMWEILRKVHRAFFICGSQFTLKRPHLAKSKYIYEFVCVHLNR